MEVDRSRDKQNRLQVASIRPIQVPIALGAARLGVDEGSGQLDAGLRAHWERRKEQALRDRLLDSLHVPVEPLRTTNMRPYPRQALSVEPIAAASLHIAGKVNNAIANGELPVTLGGDHSLAIGSVAGAAMAAERLAVIWIDAHGDLNWPEVSPTGHVHGMPLGISLGRGPDMLTRIGCRSPKLRPDDTYMIGIRNLDPAEREWLREGNINHVTTAEIDSCGLGTALRSMIERIRASGVDAVHVSFDVDVLDPTVMPATGTRVWGGLSFREAAHLLRLLRQSDLPIRSLDWTELNPHLDESGQGVQVATELLSVALGEEPF